MRMRKGDCVCRAAGSVVLVLLVRGLAVVEGTQRMTRVGKDDI